MTLNIQWKKPLKSTMISEVLISGVQYFAPTLSRPKVDLESCIGDPSCSPICILDRPLSLYVFIHDPMRSSSLFHWCPWIRDIGYGEPFGERNKTANLGPPPAQTCPQVCVWPRMWGCISVLLLLSLLLLSSSLLLHRLRKTRVP